MSPELQKILEDVVSYCEQEAIYDKLGNYGDFYYKIKGLLAGVSKEAPDRPRQRRGRLWPRQRRR